MVEQVRARVRREKLDVHEFQRRLDQADADGVCSYDAAFKFLGERRGQDVVNEVVHAAVLRARKRGGRGITDLAALERDLDGWALSRGTRALGALLARFAQMYPGPVLTTNFDPLLSVAVMQAGGRPRRVVLDRDGRLPSSAEVDPEERLIVYLHGYWRDSDTHHTGTELTAPRPQLDASLARLLDRRLVVIVGYGGWEDAFMRAVSSLLDDAGAKLNVAWALHDDDPGELIDNHAGLVDCFDHWRSGGRFTLFAGIDAHDLFQRLLHEASTSAKPAAKSPRQRPPAAQERFSEAGKLPARTSPASKKPAHSTALHRPRMSPEKLIASQLHEAAGAFDHFIRQYGVRALTCPPMAGEGRTLLQTRLVDLQRALGKLSDAMLTTWPDRAFVVMVRTPRNDAWDEVVELSHIVAQREDADADLRQLVESLVQVRDLIRDRVLI